MVGKQYRIKKVAHLEGGPAEIDVFNGIIYIDRKEWDKLPKWAKAFILEHEMKHGEGFFDETAADFEALLEYIKDGYSLRQAIRTLKMVKTPSPANMADRARILERNYYQHTCTTKGKNCDHHLLKEQTVNPYGNYTVPTFGT